MFILFFILQAQEISVDVKTVLKDNLSPSYILILQEKDRERALPIFIGENEAFAIQRELEGIETPRPLTHDLLLNIIKEMGGKIQKVVITEIKDGTFYAEIYIKQGNKIKKIDARPSDAVATALRANAKIYVNKKVMDEMGVDLKEGEKKEKILPEKEKPRGIDI